jgi:hypothetical protein
MQKFSAWLDYPFLSKIETASCSLLPINYEQWHQLSALLTPSLPRHMSSGRILPLLNMGTQRMWTQQLPGGRVGRGAWGLAVDLSWGELPSSLTLPMFWHHWVGCCPLPHDQCDLVAFLEMSSKEQETHKFLPSLLWFPVIPNIWNLLSFLFCYYCCRIISYFWWDRKVLMCLG